MRYRAILTRQDTRRVPRHTPVYDWTPFFIALGDSFD
jgi:hypothetical protein